MTEQRALAPHDPGHGSRHFSLMHARLLGHSALMVHSGRQLGGEPRKFGRHEQDGDSPTAWQTALGPQGDGTQGLIGRGKSCGGGGGGIG